MENTEDEVLTDERIPAESIVLKEVWPVPPEERIREFEQYLLDIGVRI